MGSRSSAGRSWKWPEVSISGRAYVMMALWLLLMPVQWVAAAVTAAAIHELGHMLAIWACGGRIWAVRVDAFGARIETGQLLGREELICALAGPGAGMLVCLFWRWVPRLAVCALMQSVFNLLPVYPMDGGRALRSAANLLSGRGYGPDGIR